MMGGTGYAVLAGTNAALASVFGKLAFDSTLVRGVLHRYVSEQSPVEIYFFPHTTISLEILEYGLRALCFACLLISNAVMMNAFVKSMALTSSINATMINSSFNYFVTALFGFFLFGEKLTLQWWIGGFCILIGLYIVNLGIQHEEQKKKENQKKRD
eukprot:TRINITY_DN16655_c0_g1_i1.p2 TRINITY_DN16655_c0_g1~~TRINITY_DN16655_c0_g1_i1.p2  ORF type:complete len:157 (-),score=38.76 TRINITY_DN16655_c0_g1_i1:50-520(-)